MGTGAVAGEAIALHHVLVDDVETVYPFLAVTERSVGRGPEISVTSPAVGGVFVIGVLLVGLGGSRPYRVRTEQNNEK
jgi:hypothetical protein